MCKDTLNNPTSISGHQVETTALAEQVAEGKGEDIVVSFNAALQSLYGWGKIRMNFVLARVKDIHRVEEWDPHGALVLRPVSNVRKDTQLHTDDQAQCQPADGS